MTSIMKHAPAPAIDGPVARRRLRADLRNPRTGMLFVAPAAIIVLVLFIVPLGVLVYMSLQDWPLLGSPTWAGFDNYLWIPKSRLFVGAVGFTLLYTALTTILVFGISFVLVAFASSSRKGAKMYRTAFFLPYVVGVAAAGLIWYAGVNDQTGLANSFLQSIHLTDGPFGFLATPAKALGTTLSLVVWKFIGFQVVVLVVGLQGIPAELYEAARLDGANLWQRLRYITLPFLRPTLALLFILSVTGSLLSFDQFAVLTRGGPDNSTVTLVYAIYNTAFVSFDLGRAAALSIVVLIALVVLNAVQLAVLRGSDND